MKIHPDYVDLPPWDGRETADITYRDRSGALTSFLVDKGYMSHISPEHLLDARPEYFIEVKSTTLPCETAFFMSKYQYKRVCCSIALLRRRDRMGLTCVQMRDFSYDQTRNINRVYMIFRVFNLGQDTVGLKVLVDPEGLRLRRELAFTAEKWSVVPSAPGGQ